MRGYKLGVYNTQGRHKLKFKFKGWWSLAQHIDKLGIADLKAFDKTHVIKYLKG